MYTSKYLNRCQFRKHNGSQCKRLGRVLCSNNGSYEYYCKQHAEKGKATPIEGASNGGVTAAGSREGVNNVQAPNVAEGKKVIDPELARVAQHYGNNIGLITPSIADIIKDALSRYPADRIIEAIDIACKANKRSWTSVNLILGRWHTNGKY